MPSFHSRHLKYKPRLVAPCWHTGLHSPKSGSYTSASRLKNADVPLIVGRRYQNRARFKAFASLQVNVHLSSNSSFCLRNFPFWKQLNFSLSADPSSLFLPSLSLLAFDSRREFFLVLIQMQQFCIIAAVRGDFSPCLNGGHNTNSFTPACGTSWVKNCRLSLKLSGLVIMVGCWFNRLAGSYQRQLKY